MKTIRRIYSRIIGFRIMPTRIEACPREGLMERLPTILVTFAIWGMTVALVRATSWVWAPGPITIKVALCAVPVILLLALSAIRLFSTILDDWAMAEDDV